MNHPRRDRGFSECAQASARGGQREGASRGDSVGQDLLGRGRGRVRGLAEQAARQSARLFLGLALVGFAVGCAGSPNVPKTAAPSAESAPAPATTRAPVPLRANLIDSATSRDDRQARVAPLEGQSADDVGVPSFQLVDLSGEALNSGDLVGKRAFAVVFFASWCELCVRKMEMVRTALEDEQEVKLLLVSVDGPETAHHVPGFLRERRLAEEQVIDGLNHPRFTRGYNPISSIPLVAIVGRSGHLVEYQVGLQSGDESRLRTALHKALEE